MRKYRNQIIAGFTIALVLYIVLLLVLENSGQLSANALDTLQQFPIEMIIPLIACQILVIFFRFVEWQYYLGVIDARDKISLLDSFIIFTAGFTMVVSPAKVAEILKAVFLKTKSGVPIARSAPIVVAERVVDGIAVIVLMFLTLVFAGDQLALGEYEAVSKGIIYGAAAVLAFGLIVVQIKPLAYFFLNLLAYIPMLDRLQEPLIEFYESSREIFKIKHVIPMTVVGVGVYGASSIGFTLVLIGFGLEFSWQLFLQAAFITGVAAAVGALSFVPNGAGVTEFSNSAMLRAIVLPLYPAISLGVGTAAALIQGFFHKWFRVLVGLTIIVIFRKRLFTPQVEAAIAEMEAERDHKHHPLAVAD